MCSHPFLTYMTFTYYHPVSLLLFLVRFSLFTFPCRVSLSFPCRFSLLLFLVAFHCCFSLSLFLVVFLVAFPYRFSLSFFFLSLFFVVFFLSLFFVTFLSHCSFSWPHFTNPSKSTDASHIKQAGRIFQHTTPTLFCFRV
jgi:hypothetical protein